MLTFAACPERAGEISAVVHMGTGRLQSVRGEWNPLYYEKVWCSGEDTGAGVAETSFSLRGKPMVTMWISRG